MGISSNLPTDARAQSRFRVIFILLVLALSIPVWFFLERYHPPTMPPSLDKASEALQHKDIAKARALFDDALKRNPQSPLLYAQICDVCSSAEQFSLEADYARRGVQACRNADDHTRAALYRALSSALSAADTPHPQTEAIFAAQRAVALDPDNPMTLNGLGYVLADNDRDLDEAQSLITKALRAVAQQSEPQPSVQIGEIEDSYGWVLYKKKQYNEAADMLNQAIADMPEESLSSSDMKVLYYHLGAACRMAGRFDAARNALDKALHYDSDYALAKAEMKRLPPPGTPPSSVHSSPALSHLSEK